MALVIEGFDFSARFKREYAALEPDAKNAVDDALRLLRATPGAKALRLHRLTGFKPPIWKIDMFTNHSWQITFEMVGRVAVLKRVGRHRSIDRTPR